MRKLLELIAVDAGVLLVMVSWLFSWGNLASFIGDLLGVQ